MLKVIHVYLSGRSLKTEMSYSFSDLLDIYGVPQRSILGSILVNINLYGLLLSEYNSEFTIFAEDTIPDESRKSYDDVINKFEITEKLFDWFYSNYLRANSCKCHFFSHPNQ